MSLLQRVASFATMALGIAALVGTSTPGLAHDLDRQTNASSSNSVPAVLIPAISTVPVASATVQPAPLDNEQDAAPVSDTPAPGDTVAYPSLDAAVAAQDVSSVAQDDLACMAGAIYFEAKGEPLSGQLAVAQVILNRAKSGRFPPSVCSVIKQPGQFSFVHGGVIKTGVGAAYRTALAVAKVALADAWDGPAANALYFHARRVAPGWRMTKIASIGNHVFYR